MNDDGEHPKPVRTLRQHFWEGIRDAQRRRPVSFYLLLSIPVVLLLAVHLFRSTEDPRRLAFGLSILFVYLGVVLIRAAMDILVLVRRLVAEHRQSFKETLGDDEFLEALRARRAERKDG